MTDSNHEKQMIKSVHAPAVLSDSEWQELVLDRVAFNRRQTEVFDQACDFFASDSAVPSDVRARLEKFLALSLTEKDYLPGVRFLDVGAGCGVLTGLLLEVNPGARVTAVDFSTKMLEVLKKRYPGVLTLAGDVLDISSPSAFDCVWINACFGNFFDPAAVLRHLAGQMSYGAHLHISHPLGRKFQARLHGEDPLTVPHKLPSSKEQADEWFSGSGLEFVRLVDQEDHYLLSYQRV